MLSGSDLTAFRLFAVTAGFVVALVFPLDSVAAARIHPVDSVRITSVRGWRVDPFGSGKMLFHNGWDYAVPKGTAVYPTERGQVYYAGWHKGYGWLVVVDHFNGYFTMYGHNSRLLVSTGQHVAPDSPISLAGSTGRSTGSHVHYEVRYWPNRYDVLIPETPDQELSEDWIASWVGEGGGVGGE